VSHPDTRRFVALRFRPLPGSCASLVRLLGGDGDTARASYITNDERPLDVPTDRQQNVLGGHPKECPGNCSGRCPICPDRYHSWCFPQTPDVAERYSYFTVPNVQPVAGPRPVNPGRFVGESFSCSSMCSFPCHGPLFVFLQH